MSCSFLLLGLVTQAQQWSISFGGGSGKNYIEEDAGSEWISYGNPVATHLDLRYRSREQSAWTWIARMQYLNSVRKQTFANSTQIMEGDLASFSYYLLLERDFRVEKKWHSGVYAGMGKTSEYMRLDIVHSGINQNYEAPQQKDFMSIAVGAMVQYVMTPKLSIELSPCFYWFDPVNSIRGFAKNEKFSKGGEDWHAVLQLGLAYRFL